MAEEPHGLILSTEGLDYPGAGETPLGLEYLPGGLQHNLDMLPRFLQLLGPEQSQ